MLLQEINADGQPAYELANIVKYFPKTYTKIIHKLAGKPDKLTYRGLHLYDEDGNGPALDGAINAAEELREGGELLVDVALSVQTGGNRLFEYEAPVKNMQHVWTAYNVDGDALLLGFDAWIDEEDFNEHWDKFFEEEFGEQFDYDNDEHREIFDVVHRNFLKIGFYGLLIQVHIGNNLHPTAEVLHYGDRGFFRGTKPYADGLKAIEL